MSGRCDLSGTVLTGEYSYLQVVFQVKYFAAIRDGDVGICYERMRGDPRKQNYRGEDPCEVCNDCVLGLVLGTCYRKLVFKD